MRKRKISFILFFKIKVAGKRWKKKKNEYLVKVSNKMTNNSYFSNFKVEIVFQLSFWLIVIPPNFERQAKRNLPTQKIKIKNKKKMGSG